MDAHDLTAAYALDALAPDEAEAYERHLSQCEECREQLAELTETATGLAFSGDSAGNALALRTSDGSTLWHAGIGRVGNSPITYELDGRQYVILGGGSALYAFALPEER